MPQRFNLENFIGNTPLVQLKRLLGSEGLRRGNRLFVKLEGNNPAGSVKDRPALSMFLGAEKRGELSPRRPLVEATSGNTGIALAMVAAAKGYPLILVMPDNQTLERRHAMAAFGAELILVPREGGMEEARDTADRLVEQRGALMLNQFANADNPLAHYLGTGPEIWKDTEGSITHFVSAMGTTGTIMGVSRYLKEKNSAITIVGCQPEDGSQIAGIRKWQQAYLPKIFDRKMVDRIEEINQTEAEVMTRRLAREEGILAGVSSGGAVAVALRVASELENATLVAIVCDRGDRYLSTGIYA